MIAILTIVTFTAVSAAVTDPSQLPKKDYSCYHANSWVNNADNHYNKIFSAYTDILQSTFENPSRKKQQHNSHSVIKSNLRAPSFFPAVRPLSSSPPPNGGSMPPHTGSPPPNAPHPQGSPPPNQGKSQPPMSGSPPPCNGGGSHPPSVSSPPPGSVAPSFLGTAPPMNGSPPPNMNGSPPPCNNGGSAPPNSGGGGGGGGGGQTGAPKYSNVTIGWKVAFTGIPNYDHDITTQEIQTLNARPRATTDFSSANHETTATVGELVVFGQNIGYNSDHSCALDYWPPGPDCPTSHQGTNIFTLTPAPELQPQGCYTSNQLGYFVNGVAIFDWADMQSYQSEGEWNQNAVEFEKYDMDICWGHAAQGMYHHHSFSPCLANQLNDDGNGHSPIYGFAFDGFPIFGPYQAANQTTAKSCWQKRDYSPHSPVGCPDGQRSCVLIDEFNITRGLRPLNASFHGPNLTATLTTASQNLILAASGVYYEDYYYNETCTAQGLDYLDAFNGHDHRDGLGFHYHLTIDEESGNPVFPYLTGPKYFGCQPNGMECIQSHYQKRGGPNTRAAAVPPSNGGQQPQQKPPVLSKCGVSQAVPLTQQTCLADSWTSPYYIGDNNNNNDDNSGGGSSTDSSSSNNNKTGLSKAGLVAVVFFAVVIAVLILFCLWRRRALKKNPQGAMMMPCCGKTQRRVSFMLDESHVNEAGTVGAGTSQGTPRAELVVVPSTTGGTPPTTAAAVVVMNPANSMPI